MPYIGNIPAESYAAFNVQYFTTSATDTYTLDRAVANELDIRLVINNVIQEPGSGKAYTAAGTTLTLSAATAGSDTMYCVYIGKAVQTVNPGAGSVGTTALATNAVTQVKMADNSVGTAEILDTNVTGAKLNDDAISAQSALGAEPADTDEFLVSDAGVLKRVDYSYIKAPNAVSLRPNAQPLIINGDMAVAQRTTSTSSVSSGANYVSDRFGFNPATAGTWTISQEAITSGSPFDNGFRTAFKADNTTANGSLSAGSSLQFTQKIEAQDLQVLKYGSSNAEKMTLCFWVKATKTGTNVIEIYGHDSGRSVSVAYTVSTTNTWEKKTVLIPADTGGTINNDNGTGLEIIWWLAAGTNFTSGSLQTSWGANTATARAVGQVNNADSTSNNVHITAVQLEVGEYTSSTIPPFQHESFGDNLERCQRYFFKNNSVANMPMASGVCNGTTNARAVYYFPKTMRANPSLDKSSSTDFKVQIGGSVHDTTNVAFYYQNLNQALLYVDVSSGLTDGKGCLVIDDGGSNIFISGSAEL